MSIRVVHVLFRFAVGGLENGVVNLVNGLDHGDYAHTIVSLSEHDEAFCRRVTSGNVEFRALHKRPGNDFRTWSRLSRLLGEVRPHVLHTRNFAALEMQAVGCAARVPGRIHGEHGWDMNDLDGRRRKYRLVRRIVGYGVHRFIALSRDLERYLVDRVGVPRRKVVQIYNGVDDTRFAPPPRRTGGVVTVGTVGRMKAVKNQTLLCRAFMSLLQRRPDLASRMRLVLVGAGPLEQECRAIAGSDAPVEFRGETDAVADALREMDVFVLPSLAEGISNTILEAMATALPVIATAVGGNPELVVDGESGVLVPPGDESALGDAMERYVDDPALRDAHGTAGRQRVERQFSLAAMLRAYDAEYRRLAAV